MLCQLNTSKNQQSTQPSCWQKTKTCPSNPIRSSGFGFRLNLPFCCREVLSSSQAPLHIGDFLIPSAESSSCSRSRSAQQILESSCVRSYASPRHQSRRRWSWGQNHSESSSSYLRQDWFKSIVYGQVVNGDRWHYVRTACLQESKNIKEPLLLYGICQGLFGNMSNGLNLLYPIVSAKGRGWIGQRFLCPLLFLRVWC